MILLKEKPTLADAREGLLANFKSMWPSRLHFRFAGLYGCYNLNVLENRSDSSIANSEIMENCRDIAITVYCPRLGRGSRANRLFKADPKTHDLGRVPGGPGEGQGQGEEDHPTFNQLGGGPPPH